MTVKQQVIARLTKEVAASKDWFSTLSLAKQKSYKERPKTKFLKAAVKKSNARGA